MDSFDPQAFALLLKKLIGERSIQDFAKEAGVSKYQVSRRLNASLPGAPRTSTLRLYADHAMNGVTYEDLLSCCGYELDTDPSSPAIKADHIRVAKVAVLASIFDLGLPVKPSFNSPALPCDFELIVGEDPAVTWDFSCISSDIPLPEAAQQIDQSFQGLMYARLNAYEKYSFLTQSKKAFENILAHSPVNLSVNVSALLYSPADLNVLEETTLSVSASTPVPEKYCFKPR